MPRESELSLSGHPTGSTTPLWAFDVSTSWHHRAVPPVGITRTEIEYARYICQHHPNTLLTVYDQPTRSHLVLPTEQGQRLLGFADPSPTAASPAREENAASDSPTASPAPLHGAKKGRRMSFAVEMAAFLSALLLLPTKSSMYRTLKRHTLKRLARRGSSLPENWREWVERRLRVHPTRPKYLQEYLDLKRQLAGRPEPPPDPGPRVERLDFSTIDKYISAGCGWDMNDLEAVYRYKQQYGFSVTTCLYDLVPIVMPDVVAPRLNEIFPPYLCNLLWASDGVACISESAKRELEEFIRETGAPRPHIEVCRLGSAPDAGESAGRPRVADHLVGRPFALYVATFEPRKNHEFLHFLWNELVRQANVEPIPLVLAGRQGWRTENLLERMRLNTKLHPEHLVLAEGLTDAEIAWLYRNCRFTVFPSLYEGWGLPVSESLFHGKFCIASDRSSLPEAGAGLIRHIDLLDGRGWLAEIERCISDDAYLRARQETIVREFEPRTWQEAAAGFFSLVCRTGQSTRAEDGPRLRRAA